MGRGAVDRPVTPGNGNGGETTDVAVDTRIPEDKLREEDEADAERRPDTPQETTGGVEQRDARPQRVKYRGMGQRRKISEAEWKSAGVHNQGDTEWNRLNKWTVAVGGEGGLSDNALNLIADESEFTVE